MTSHFWVLSIGKLFIFWLTIGSRYSDSRNVGQLQNVEPSDPKKYTNVLQNLEVIVRETGKYGTIEVIKDTLRDRLYMKNGNSILGSEKIEARTSTLMSQHIQSAVVYTRPNMKCFLQIGLGVGSVSKSLWRWKSHVHIDVVELNPLVVSFAKKHFGWRNFKGNTFTMDGRQFLDKAKELTLDHKYDAILIDVYSDLGMNSSNDGNYMGNIVGMYTRECFEKVKERLKDGGVLVVVKFFCQTIPELKNVAMSITHEERSTCA
jgi:spermidine synthase